MSAPDPDGLELLKLLVQGEEARSRADRASQAATSEATRAQAVLDAVYDGARHLAPRNRELRASAGAVRDSLDRARLAALNAGLEGARLGEPMGRAVLTMADDVRALLTRAIDTLDEHLSLFGEVEREREQWIDELSQSRELSASAVQRLRELGGIEAAASQAMRRLQANLRRSLGTEPERAELLAEASERARSLGEAVTRLRSLGAPDDPAISALLEPLSALLRGGNGNGTP
jgi:methyl-accepting chemotaxis protein